MDPKHTPTPLVLKERDFAADSSPVERSAQDTATTTAPEALHIHSDTATDTSDFDWDTEDDEPKENDNLGPKRGLRRIWVAFMRMARPVRTLIVGLIGVGMLLTPLLVFQFRFKDSVAGQQVHIWSLWFSVVFAAGCLTFLVVDNIPRIIISLVNLFGGQVERLKVQMELIFAVTGPVKLTLDISWAWISLSVIRAIYKPPESYWTIVNRVLQALFASSIVLLVEKTFLHFVAINFHEKALAERLAENRLGLKALDRLSNAPALASNRRAAAARKGHKSPSASIDLNHVAEQPKAQSASARRQNRKKAMTSIIVDQVGGAFSEVLMKNSKFNRNSQGGMHSARKLARNLFGALSNVNPPREHLLVEDFYAYFKSTAEAHAAFALLDKDSNGDISKKEMKEAVQRIYRERKALVASLTDVGSAIAKLDAVLLAITLVVVIFLCLLIFNRDNTLTSLVPLATVILGFSFIFGNSAATLFESLIFIFSTHVFDVGDLVLIDDQPLFVREFGLFSTTFRRVDGQEIIAPNQLLASSKLIHNLRRSNAMTETTTLTVSYDTPLEVIEELRARITAYVAQHSREWSGGALNIDKMEYQNSIVLIVAMEHRSSWQDWGGRWQRRTEFMRNLKIILEDLDLKYSMPTQPILLPTGHGINPALAMSSQEALGNAGRFPSSQSLRAPSRSLRAGGDTF